MKNGENQVLSQECPKPVPQTSFSVMWPNAIFFICKYIEGFCFLQTSEF